MKETLDKIITDKHLAWNKTLMDKKQQFVVELGSEIIEEIIKRRNELDKLNENDLPLLKNKILDFRREILLDGVGLFIINGVCLKNFSLKEKISIYTLIAKILGELIIQNIRQEKIVEIKDIGKSMKTGGRYHETREGGSHHTDSPQWKEVPDYLKKPYHQVSDHISLSFHPYALNCLDKLRRLFEIEIMVRFECHDPHQYNLEDI